MEASTFCKIVGPNNDVRYVAYPANQLVPAEENEVVTSVSEEEYISALVANTTKVKTNKELKTDAVNVILVTTSTGKVFDGDEASQDRMLRAIQIANITTVGTTQWKLADNTIVEVTLEELKEALSLAGQEMSRIWLGD